MEYGNADPIFHQLQWRSSIQEHYTWISAEITCMLSLAIASLSWFLLNSLMLTSGAGESVVSVTQLLQL